MYPANTALVLEFLYPGSRPLDDWEVQDDGRQVTLAAWRLPQPQPNAGEITAAAASPGFAAWMAELRDPVRSKQREARQQLRSDAPAMQAVDAKLQALLDSLNECRAASGLTAISWPDVLATGEGKLDSPAASDVELPS